jgi:hypothetical protein
MSIILKSEGDITADTNITIRIAEKRKGYHLKFKEL